MTEAGRSVVVAVPDIEGGRSPAAAQASAAGQQRASSMLPQAGIPASLLRGERGRNFHTDRGERTGIQGPSFLGLSDESEDDTAYLLEEENSSGSGLRKLVLLVILAAIIGLIFVQYRSSLHANPKPPEPARGSPQGQNQPAPAATAPEQQSQAAGQPAPAGAVAEPSPQAAAANSVLPQLPNGNGNDTAAQITPEPSPQVRDPMNVVEKSTSDAPDLTDKGENSAAAEDALNAPVPAEQKPSPTLVRAQQFLHGRGVQQNCDQGLLYLRAAAQKNEPAAAVQMGALYASGHCVHQDRVVAYRWFNSAHELQPANQWILKNMDLLWTQMTAQERRLAAY